MKKSFYVMAAALCIAASLASCGSSSSTSQATAESAAAASTPAASSEAPAASETAGLAIGETATLGDWSIAVTGFNVADSISADYSGYFSPDEGNHYGVVSLSITNNGKQSASFLPSFSLSDDVSAEIHFGDGYEFTPTTLLGYSQDLHDSTLNPLSSKDGVVVFELPDSVTSSTEPLSLVFSAGFDSVTFVLR